MHRYGFTSCSTGKTYESRMALGEVTTRVTPRVKVLLHPWGGRPSDFAIAVTTTLVSRSLRTTKTE